MENESLGKVLPRLLFPYVQAFAANGAKVANASLGGSGAAASIVATRR